MQGCHCHSPKHLLWLSMLHFALMSQVKLRVIDKIHPQGIEFASGVECKPTGNPKLSGSPEDALLDRIKFLQLLELFS